MAKKRTTLKKVSIKDMEPRHTQIIVKVPEEAYVDNAGAIIEDLNTKEVRIDQWVAKGNPFTVCKVGPQVDDIKPKDHVILANRALQSTLGMIEEEGEYWIIRAVDVICTIK
tara:strand:- start:913 stop:1248 length:336 start_codon:yes stop_codon:yes gene_type:complete